MRACSRAHILLYVLPFFTWHDTFRAACYQKETHTVGIRAGVVDERERELNIATPH